MCFSCRIGRPALAMALDHRFEPLFDAFGERRNRVLLLHPLPTGDTVELDDASDGRLQSGHAVGFDEKAGVAIPDDLRWTSAPIGDHRYPGRYRFDGDVSECLDPLRRHHDRPTSTDR